MTELNLLKPPIESLNHSSKLSQRDLEKELKLGKISCDMRFFLLFRKTNHTLNPKIQFINKNQL